MDTHEREYELLARHLDGEPGALTVAQQAQADEIRRDEQWLGVRLDVHVPHSVLPRAGAALEEALAERVPRHRSRVAWRVLTGGLAASVAAAIIVAVLIWPTPPRTKDADPGAANLTAGEAVATYLQNEPSAFDAQVGMLSLAVDNMMAEASQPAPSSLEMEIDALGGQLDQFWLEMPGLEPIEGIDTTTSS